jgi:hypothetical protein
VFVGDGLGVGVVVGDGLGVGVVVGDEVGVGVLAGEGVAGRVDAGEDDARNGGMTALLLGLLVDPVKAPLLWGVGTELPAAWPPEPLVLPAPPPLLEEPVPGVVEFA